jgi:hypothetical protein
LQLTSNHGPVSHLFSPAKGFEAPALNGTARCATPCWSRWRANCRRCAAIAAGGWRLAVACAKGMWPPSTRARMPWHTVWESL